MPAPYPSVDTLRADGWMPVPRECPPFPSIIAASKNDPLGSYQRAAELAAAWGGRIVNIGAVGLLNPAAGFGPWPRAEEFVAELAASRR